MSMDCACAIDPSYGCDEAYSHTEPAMITSDSVEKCTECSGKIQPGTQHEHITFTYPESPNERRETCLTCPDCLSLRKNFFCSWAYGCLWDDFSEYVQEYLEDFPYALLAKLTPAARANACDIIEEEWAEQSDDEED